jgi:Holliday junction resolvase RusA-like endonuclease
MRPRQPARGTKTQLCLTLPLPPSVNNQYYTDERGRRRLTPPALRYKSQVRKKLRGLWLRDVLCDTLLERLRDPEKYLALSAEYFFGTPLQRDLDNGCKLTIDALCRGLSDGKGSQINDNRVVDLHLSSRGCRLHPHLSIEIETLDTWDFAEEYAVLKSGRTGGTPH